MIWDSRPDITFMTEFWTLTKEDIFMPDILSPIVTASRGHCAITFDGPGHHVLLEAEKMCNAVNIGGTSHLHWIIGQVHCIMGSLDWLKFPPFFKGHWQSPCTALTAGKCLPLRLSKGTVNKSIPAPPVMVWLHCYNCDRPLFMWGAPDTMPNCTQDAKHRNHFSQHSHALHALFHLVIIGLDIGFPISDKCHCQNLILTCIDTNTHQNSKCS